MKNPKEKSNRTKLPRAETRDDLFYNPERDFDDSEAADAAEISADATDDPDAATDDPDAVATDEGDTAGDSDDRDDYFEYDRDASRRFFGQGEEPSEEGHNANEYTDDEYATDEYAGGEYDMDEYLYGVVDDTDSAHAGERVYGAEQGHSAGKGNSGRKRVKRRKKNTFRNIVIGVAIVIGLYFIATSELFAIRAIEILTSGSHYTNVQIVGMSGITQQDNLWKISTGNIATKLMKDPYIENAVVGRSPPNTITIAITERAENYAVPFGGKYVVLDYSGIVLRLSDEAPPVPLIEGIEVKKADPGAGIETTRDILLADAVKLIQDAENNGLIFKKIVLKDTDTVAYISDTLSVSGVLGNLDKDLGKVKSVLLDLDKQKINRGTILVNNGGTCTFSPEES